MIGDFLSRWSRRKQAAAQAAEPARAPPCAESPVAPEHAGGPREPASRDTSEHAPDPGAPAFDPASLPPIDTITAETDIRAFIGAGVPAELTRAALRRVWTSDPKIRDFVGLADYAWDFNTPGAMAGFGPLAGDDALRAQVARWVGPDIAEDTPAETSDHDSGTMQEAPPADAGVHDQPDQPTRIATEDERAQKIAAAPDEPTRPGREHIATQQQQKKPEEVPSMARHKHGRALPE
jgi:hypothetical protein